MSNNFVHRFILDVPFREKNDAKSMGFTWNRQDKHWYHEGSPSNRDISLFMRWNPRVYLHVPYEEKDLAKRRGASWDPHRKQWFIENELLYEMDSFMPWFSPFKKVTASAAVTTPKKRTSSISKPSKPSASSQPPTKKKKLNATRIGNSKDATALRITDFMTVPQLQDECRFRGIRGFSGKSKAWLLETLHVGSVWKSVNDNNRQSTFASASFVAFDDKNVVEDDDDDFDPNTDFQLGRAYYY